MHSRFGLALGLLLLAGSTAADDSESTDPVEVYRRQIATLRKSYNERVQEMEQSKSEMASKFTELAENHRDDAVAKLRVMTTAVQATDLDRAIELRNAADELEKEAVPSVSEPKVRESSSMRSLRAQVRELESQLDTAFRLNQQLLVNASFEQVPRRGVVSGWQSRSGEWQLAGAEYAKSNEPHAAEGKAFLYAGACRIGHLVQDVDISVCSPLTDAKKLRFTASALIRCFPQSPPDTCELKLEFLDERDVVMKTLTTKPHANPHNWIPIGMTDIVPQKTRTIRVNIVSTRHGARSRDNNGYFDDSKLVLERIR